MWFLKTFILAVLLTVPSSQWDKGQYCFRECYTRYVDTKAAECYKACMIKLQMWINLYWLANLDIRDCLSKGFIFALTSLAPTSFVNHKTHTALKSINRSKN
ncbi:unnamed protein product [Cylicocyclus nassatus]|uniref:Uncharacterized protein n=1 Tax=Cylicocyclus nassatus TaxID=53992 RepID=A0AA36M652_CYLNA|nr:unnamed protein product [Cylicocyclus nassatus]